MLWNNRKGDCLTSKPSWFFCFSASGLCTSFPSFWEVLLFLVAFQLSVISPNVTSLGSYEFTDSTPERPSLWETLTILLLPLKHFCSRWMITMNSLSSQGSCQGTLCLFTSDVPEHGPCFFSTHREAGLASHSHPNFYLLILFPGVRD